MCGGGVAYLGLGTRMFRRSAGFSLIELLVVILIIGVIAAIAVPRLFDALERSRQRRTMADMRELATANSLYFLDNGDYAPALGDLDPTYFPQAPLNDAWGTPYRYLKWVFFEDLYWLWSYGSDQAVGPFPGQPWLWDPPEGDIIMLRGEFLIAPTGS